MNHGKLMKESYLGNSSSNASSSGLKHQKQFPLPALSKEENRFFQEAPPQKKKPGIGGCSQLQDYSVFPKSVLSSFQAIQRKGRNNSTLHSCSQPLQTIEESSCWYRYVPRTFFNAHSFKRTYRGQNISFLSELAEHFKLPLGSGFCSGVQNRVSGISPPVLHSQHPCIRGPGNSRYPTETRHLQGFRTQW